MGFPFGPRSRNRRRETTLFDSYSENGGNATHQFLDGRPQLFVYPFESQPGAKYVSDMLSSAFPLKYRWPVFPLEATPFEDYKAIIDEECKVRTRTPNVSKFRHMPFELNDDERCAIYQQYIAKTGRGTGKNVAAFFRATFDAWKNSNRSGKELVYVGYSPIITIDTEKILRDLPQAHILHVVRYPWSAFADTSKRPMAMSLENYLSSWTLNQYYALLYRDLFPERVHIVRAEDVMASPSQTLGAVCQKLGLESSESLRKVTWNGQELDQVYPRGTIRTPTPKVNLATARELTEAQTEQIRRHARPYLEAFDYKSFV